MIYLFGLIFFVSSIFYIACLVMDNQGKKELKYREMRESRIAKKEAGIKEAHRLIEECLNKIESE